MLPLALFRSRSFSGANLLTFLPLRRAERRPLLLSLEPDPGAGLLANRSRRRAAALHRVDVPAVALVRRAHRALWGEAAADRRAAGRRRRALRCLPGPASAARTGPTFFPAVIVLGFGMAISVAPLTTTVMNSVPRTMPASPRASTTPSRGSPGLLAIAVFGVVLYAAFNRALDREFGALELPPAVRAEIDAQRRMLGAARTNDPQGARPSSARLSPVIVPSCGSRWRWHSQAPLRATASMVDTRGIGSRPSEKCGYDSHVVL